MSTSSLLFTKVCYLDCYGVYKAFVCVAYELWFKQVLFEVDSICEILMENVRLIMSCTGLRQEILSTFNFCRFRGVRHIL